MEDFLPALGAILGCDEGEIPLGLSSIAYEVVSGAGHPLRVEGVSGGIVVVVVVVVGQSRRPSGLVSW